MRIPPGLEAWIDRDAGAAAEGLWLAALAMIGRVADEERTRVGQWHHWPRGRVRRLRRDLAHAIALARIALELEEAEQTRADELAAEIRAAAAEAGKRRRREQTIPAERARLRRQT